MCQCHVHWKEDTDLEVQHTPTAAPEWRRVQIQTGLLHAGHTR